jgi:hypothetical protein
MRHRSETNKPINPAAPICWHREPSSACLRIEPPGGELHVFPYQHFVTALLTRSEDGETLRLSFSSHQVEITGRNLRDLLLALQDFAVKWVRNAPERFAMLAESEASMVTRIHITAVQTQG